MESIDGFNAEKISKAPQNQNAAVFNEGILQQQEENIFSLADQDAMDQFSEIKDTEIEENTNKEQPNGANASQSRNAAVLQKGVLQQQQQENSLIAANSNIWNVKTHESMQDMKIEEHSNKMEQNKAINGSRDTQLPNASVMSKGILSNSMQSASASNIYSINTKVQMVEFSEMKDTEIEENASKDPQNESQSKSFLDGLSALDLSGDSDAFWKAF